MIPSFWLRISRRTVSCIGRTAHFRRSLSQVFSKLCTDFILLSFIFFSILIIFMSLSSEHIAFQSIWIPMYSNVSSVIRWHALQKIAGHIAAVYDRRRFAQALFVNRFVELSAVHHEGVLLGIPFQILEHHLSFRLVVRGQDVALDIPYQLIKSGHEFIHIISKCYLDRRGFLNTIIGQ
ncbi:MAG: hypothetical protein DRQ65_00865 [Gammaproteobacteria bacterium]|nr:MAG: hypothetical protein DRQ65_00865 [Gammaproteobacteria bacterium]